METKEERLLKDIICRRFYAELRSNFVSLAFKNHGIGTADAKDIFQETMEKFVQKLNNCEIPATINADYASRLLYVIFDANAVNFVRSKKKFNNVSFISDSGEEKINNIADTDSYDKPKDNISEKLLGVLTDRSREVFSDHFLRNMPYEVIAVRHNMNYNSVKQMISASRKRILRNIEDGTINLDD